MHRNDLVILLEQFDSGGVARVACHVANGIAAHGYRVEIWTRLADGPARHLLDPSVGTRCLGGLPGRQRKTRLVGMVPALAMSLRREKPAVFHSPGNNTHIAAFLGHALACEPGIAFVPKITNPLIKDSLRGVRRLRRQALYRRILARSSCIMVLSQADEDRMGDEFPRASSRIAVVHNPYVSGPTLSQDEKRAPLIPPIILSVGRLSEQKNHELLLRAAARLKHRDWRVHIAGDGPKGPVLRQLACELGIEDRVTLLGFVPDVASHYREAVVLALPSRWEGLPATVLEALAAGCPVVATSCSPALASLAKEVKGLFLVEPNEVSAFAAALDTALASPPIVAAEAVEKYRIEASVAEHLALLRPFMDQRA